VRAWLYLHPRINPLVIQRGIRSKYSGLEISGREYLEKILNYSFAVPAPDPQALSRFATARLGELLTDEQARGAHSGALKEFGEALAACRFSNPRKIKRILNSYLLFLVTTPSLGNYDESYVTRMIVLAEYYPELFAALSAASTDEQARTALAAVADVQAHRTTAAQFQDAYGFSLEPTLADFATMPRLLEFPAPVGGQRAPLVKHLEAVRAVCGRV
jgi:hypothetical protein